MGAELARLRSCKSGARGGGQDGGGSGGRRDGAGEDDWSPELSGRLRLLPENESFPGTWVSGTWVLALSQGAMISPTAKRGYPNNWKGKCERIQKSVFKIKDRDAMSL